MRWFLTQKISWNQTNRFPHHTFWWEGIDGTRIFTHFPPADTYNGTLTGQELAHAVRNFADKGGGTRSLLPFGHGDGGGGPTREMLERAGGCGTSRDLPASYRGSRRVLRGRAGGVPERSGVVGELYLELHRATYTTQANTKASNRRCEHLLREAELWSVAASVRSGARYPYEKLDRLWKTVLLHQFHDILPGQLDRLGVPGSGGGLPRGSERAGADHRTGHSSLAHADGWHRGAVGLQPVATLPRRSRVSAGDRARRTTVKYSPTGPSRSSRGFRRLPVHPSRRGGKRAAGEVETTETTLDNGLLRVE